MIIGQEDNKAILLQAINNSTPCLLMGETGTGKTSLIREIADSMDQELIRINLTGQTSTDEFLGKWLIKDQQTVWVDGALTTAMRKGYWIVIDEINVALPEILFCLHSLLDDDKKIMLSEKDGEVVQPDKNFRLFATMNPTTEYAGTKELNKAFLSRFAVVLWFDYPTAENEIKILSEYTNVDNAKLMVQLGSKIRELKKAEQIFYTCSTRDLKQWSLLVDSLGIEKAFQVSILNKADVDKTLITCEYNNIFEPIKEVVKKYQVDYVSQVLGKIQKEETKAKKLLADLDTRKKQIVQELVEFQAVKKAKRIVRAIR
jgi:midasin (ATPase involved in ribosome maturation)